MTADDRSEALRDAVRSTLERGGWLRIAGAGSKAHLTRGDDSQPPDPGGVLLSVAEHAGVIDHRPEELVVTARAGTPLKELERLLARAGQHLPFEPPRLRGGGTLGGAVACGLSGPARPWRGSVRDALLGLELLNGRGEHMRFGGQVMKNVAGYDLARLQAGAFGTLGLILSVSVKVLPLPECERTRSFALDAARALELCRAWARQPVPLSATCYHDGMLRVRLSGAASAVAQAEATLGGDPEDGDFWTALRDHRLAPFGAAGLWRGAVPPAARWHLEDSVVCWAGAERWWPAGADVTAAAAAAAAEGGHARPFDGGYGVQGGARLGAAERRYTERVRHAFDPQRVFNRDLTAAASAGAPHAH